MAIANGIKVAKVLGKAVISFPGDRIIMKVKLRDRE
jgi:hypothetical protein